MESDNLILEYRCVPGAKIHSLTGDKAHWRRRKIVKLASKGLTQAQIARKIGWSYSTVKREIYAIRKTCRIKRELNVLQ